MSILTKEIDMAALKIGQKVKVEMANGTLADAVISSEVYSKDWSAHMGVKKGTYILKMVKVKRWIKSRKEYSNGDCEYQVAQVVIQ
jgi:hypothetical protein